MPFGLVNAPAKFQNLINNIFQDIHDKGMIVFMSNIIIHTKTREKYDDIVLEVLKRLPDNRLCIAPDKCKCAKHQVEFLGYIVSGQGFGMTDEKVEALKEIEPVKT